MYNLLIFKIIDVIKLYMCMTWYILTFNVSKIRELTNEINQDSVYYFYFMVNITALGLLNNLFTQVFEEKIETSNINILNGIYEESLVEFILSFVFGYLYLAVIITVIFCYVIKDDENNLNLSTIFKCLMMVSASFYIITLIDGITEKYVTVRYVKENIVDIGVIYINNLILYVLWLVYVYKFLEFLRRKDRFIVVFSVCIAIIIPNILLRTYDRLVVYPIKNKIIEEYKEYEKSILFIEESHYISVSKDMQTRKETDDLLLLGIGIYGINKYSSSIKAYEDISCKERYKYTLAYILSTMVIMNADDENIIRKIRDIISNETILLLCGKEWIQNNTNLLEREWYEVHTKSLAENALQDIQNLSTLEEKYFKEKGGSSDYYIDDEDGIEFIEKRISNNEFRYYVKNFCRFIPLKYRL